MNICGVLVNCMPGKTLEMSETLSSLDGVEVHHVEEKAHQLIVTVEDTPTTKADEQVLAIHRTPGVVSAGLTYHSFEELDEPELKIA
ncbi:chaperone NapD [Polycladidibacter stylochi]|uniref:chaperone NapD n=1 Tax=Polycladidibacter stylochi TaxID=1807766 RepID=UPI000829D201|nr:chaperone NapD [Pseudovibrio stylochi]